GKVAANSKLIAAPSATPTNAAHVEPTASMTARTSSIRSSSVGTPTTESEEPTPRLSNRISRPNDVSRSTVSRNGGSYASGPSMLHTSGGTNSTSKGPVPSTRYAI